MITSPFKIHDFRLSSRQAEFISYMYADFGILRQIAFHICDNVIYYIPINDATFELSIFWPSDTESRITELRFSDSASLSFKTMLTSVTCLYRDVTLTIFQEWNQIR